MAHLIRPDGTTEPGLSKSGLSRRGLLRGVAATGIVAATTAAVTLGSSSVAHATEAGWRWCAQCQGLWNITNNNNYRVCPWYRDQPTRQHTWAGSGNYVLKYAYEGGGGQTGWSWCSQCSALNYAAGGVGICPHQTAGGRHLNYSRDYRLEVHWSNDGAGGQSGWRYCRDCKGLWFSGNGTRGFCTWWGPDGHLLVGSGDYKLRFGPAL